MVNESLQKASLSILIIISIAVLVIIAIFLFNSLGETCSQEFSSSVQNTLADNSTITTLSPTGEGITSLSATRHNDSWMEFDGVNDGVNAPHISLNLSAGNSLSVWIKTGSSNLTSGQDGIYLELRNSSGTSTRPATYLGIRDVTGVGQFKARIFINSSGCDDTGQSTGFAKTDEQWHHLVNVYNGTHILLYIDGFLNDTDAIKSSCINLFNSLGNENYNINIGAGRNSSQIGHVRTSMDEARIYNRAITPTEVSAIFNSGRQSNSSINNTNLILWYSFNEGSGTTVFDKSGNGNNGI